MLRGALVLTLVALVSATASTQTRRTDVVTLANGDRITGEVVRLERGRLVFKTDDAGTISFEWDRIVRLEAAREFEVVTSDFRRLIGRLGTTGQGTLVITAADGTTISVPISEITSILPLGASFWAMVDGTLDAGFTYTRSSGIAQFTLNSNTAFRLPSFVLQLTASATVTHEDDTGRDDRGAVSFSYFHYRGNLFTSGATRLETNESLGLVLRSEVGGQAGQRFVNTNRAQLETGAGLVFTDEQAVESESRQNVEGLLTFKFSFYAYNRPQTNVDVSVRYYPSLSQWGRQRIQVDSAVRRELWRDFFVSLNVFDTFDSDPPQPDAARNDVGVVTSVGWSY